MKYFTKELYKQLQSNDDEICDKAEIKWEKNIKSYSKQLYKLSTKLNKRAYNFFNKTSLHDGKLIKFEIMDYNVINDIKENISKKKKNPLTLFISIIFNKINKVYELKYDNIIQLNINHPSDELLSPYLGNGFGDWIYDELTSYDENYLCHEILFDYGSEVKIIFNKFNYSIKTVKNGV